MAEVSTDVTTTRTRFRRHAMSALRFCSAAQLIFGITTTCFPFLWPYANVGRLYLVGSTVMCGTIYWIAGIFGLIAYKSPNSNTLETTYMTSLAAAVAANYLIAADVISEFTSESDFDIAMRYFRDSSHVVYIIPFGRVPRSDFIQQVIVGRVLTRLGVGFTAILELMAAILAASIATNRKSVHGFQTVQTV
jgi:hypothetical protein